MDKIGQGGFGTVYLAVDVSIGKKWAVKYLPGEKSEYLREASMLKELHYPAIPAVVDLVTMEDGCCLVMEYLQGETLGELLRRGYHFTESEVLEIGIVLAGTMEYLHSRSPAVLYRDLKPDNIMMLTDGQIRLIDFGIASYQYEQERGRESFAGTEGYAAPEQHGGVCDERTDIFGVGITLLTLLGHKKYGRIGRVCRKCCRSDRKYRFQQARRLKEELEKILEERKQGNRYKKNIAVVFGILILAGITGALTEAAHEMQYHTLLSQAQNQMEQISPEVHSAEGKISKLMELCEQAIHLRPDREEGYLQLLEAGVKEEQTQAAIECVERLRTLYKEETAQHTKTAGRIAYLYFGGNAEDPFFYTDYEQAAFWFEKADLPQDQEIQMRQLSETLCKFSDEIDWRKMAKKLDEMEQRSQRSSRLWEETYPGLIACAEIWVTDAMYLEEYCEQPYQKGIKIYEELLRLVENQDPILHREEKRELLERLSAAYTLDGMLGKEAAGQKESLEKAIVYGDRLLDSQVHAGIRMRVLLRIASCSHLLSREEQCVNYYERAVREFPEELEVFCTYAGYLMEQDQLERAAQILKRAEMVPEAQENQNYQILKERLEGTV
ncbi:MAG: serine/threonine-protein kinase [Lachnospiraceae bacterium]|nr:serine/threonine-protein kinase [Lachnospiraceae bacterium]